VHEILTTGYQLHVNKALDWSKLCAA